MTVSAQNSYISYTGNGSTSAYSFPYKVYSATSIKVYTVVTATGVETLQTSGGSGTYDYSISVASDNDSATITLNNNLPTTHKVFITRILSLSQDLDVVEGDAFPAASFEQQLDKLTLKVQQHEEQLGRTPKYRQSTGLRSTGTIFPSAATDSDNAGKMIVYDSNGTALETSTFSLSGVTATETELNILDGCTLTTAELNQFDGFTIADEDDMSSNSATKLATQQSIKAYVDSQIATEDTIAELNDTNIGSLASGHILIYDGSDSWDNKAVSGDVTISSTGAVTIANNAVETAMINADAVTNAKIADDSIDSEHYVDGSIDTAHIADSQVTTAKIGADAVTGAKIADDAIDSEHYTDGSIDTAHIGDLQVTTGKIAADAITGAKIADDAINSEHYTDGSIDTAHIADDQVTTAKIAADAITSAEIADDAISEEHLDPTVISGLSDATIAGADHLMFFDATDSQLKKVDASELGVGGGSLTSLAGDSSPQLGGTLDVNGNLIDMNGLADGLVLDADGDTTISAPTDDQIDIEIAGADDFTFTANTFTALTGSDIVHADTGSVRNRPNVKPLIINGGMTVAQRGTVTGITAPGNYTLDRFRADIRGGFGVQVAQSTDVPSAKGFSKSLKLDVTTADGSPDANGLLLLAYFFEGQDLQLLKYGTSSAETVTVAFWVKSNKTGTFQCNLRMEEDYHLGQLVTISSADTWEHKVLTFAGNTSNAIDNDNTEGMRIQFFFDSGSDSEGGGVPSSWASVTENKSYNGTLNLGDNTANEVLITGLQMEVGSYTSSTLPAFQHESFGDSLFRCQRYYWQELNDTGGDKYSSIGLAQGTGRAYAVWQINEMRTAPTVTVSAVGGFKPLNGAGAPQAAFTSIFSAISTKTTAFLDIQGSSGLTSGQACPVGMTDGNSLRASAEI
tara:strand:+ start:5370 stop:8108 length:2739 start_codon:yes stop_codon:yes gene_type:complete